MTFDELVEGARSGRVLIGVDRAFARQLFTDVPLAVFKEESGETPLVEKCLVMGAFVLGPLALLASAVLTIVAAGWWATLFIPIGIVLWFTHYAHSSLGGARMLVAHVAFIVAGVGVVVASASARQFWIAGLAYAAALWLGRFVYVAATVLLRSFVLRNSRAYEWLQDALTIREVS